MKSLSPFNSVLVGACLVARLAHAQVVPDPNLPDCAFNDVKAAIQRIHDAGSQFAGMLDAIAAKNYLCVITTTSVNAKQMRRNAAYGSNLLWQPDSGGQRYPDGVCQDPTASLAHEINHCYEVAMGTIDRHERSVMSRMAAMSSASLRISESSAVNLENAYRTTRGLCLRTVYGDAVVPSAKGSCTDPLATPCPETPSSCGLQPKCCCWVYGGIKKNGAWYACTVDKVDVEVCNSLTVPNVSSAGCYPSPCAPDPNTPAC
jgi:hypothetical protein